jgi:hypothetical protein
MRRTRSHAAVTAALISASISGTSYCGSSGERSSLV